MNICFFSWTTKPTAISEGFADLHAELKDNPNCYFSASPASFRTPSANLSIATYGEHSRGALTFAKELKKLRAFLIKNSIAHLHIFSSSPIYGLLPWIVPEHTSISLWVHDPLTHSGEKFFIRTLKSINDWLIAKSRKLATVVVAGNNLRHQLSRSAFKSIPFETIHLPYVKSLVATTKVDIATKRKGRVIIFGRIEPYKGVEWFLNALVKFNIENSKITEIIIAGKGNLQFDFQNLDKRFSIVRINRYIPDEELKQLISSSEVAVFPYRDATGTAAIQTAGANGCKVLTTNVGSLAEVTIAEHSSVGDPNNPNEFVMLLEALLTEPLGPIEIAEQYRAQFSPHHFANELLQASINSAVNLERNHSNNRSTRQDK